MGAVRTASRCMLVVERDQGWIGGLQVSSKFLVVHATLTLADQPITDVTVSPDGAQGDQLGSAGWRREECV